MRGFVFSKWFYYGLITVLLGVLFYVDWYASLPPFNNDFAIRFMPTLIGIAFNFFILIVFFDLREKLEWKTVKKKVCQNIQFELDCLFYEILHYIKNSSMVEMRLISEGSEAKSKTILSELERLKDIEELKLNELDLKLLFEDKSSLDAFSTAARNLDAIEIKYWRFLPSELVSSLIDFRLAIHSLELAIQSYIHLKKNPILRNTVEFQEFQSSFPKRIGFSFKKLMEEMYKIWKTCAENL